MLLRAFLVGALTLTYATALAQTITSSGVGVVVPARAWDVSAEVSNKISRIHFVEGQIVRKGDLLVEFDMLFKELELRLAEAQLEKAKVSLGQAEEELSRQAALWQKNTVSEAAYLDA